MIIKTRGLLAKKAINKIKKIHKGKLVEIAGIPIKKPIKKIKKGRKNEKKRKRKEK